MGINHSSLRAQRSNPVFPVWIASSFSLLAMTILLLPRAVFAAEGHGDHPTVFHAFELETDVGAGRHDTIATWDFDGWLGTDYNKLWLKSKGEMADGATHRAELWAMYSRNVSEFWDVQAGLRYDTQPEPVTHLVLGADGLAPYYFETEAHLFISDEGDISARIRLENDVLITQRWIVQPYLEAGAFAQKVRDLDAGAGVSKGEIGLQMRYEVIRKFAPYIDLRYERLFGGTSAIAHRSGEHTDDVIASVGVRVRF